MAIYILRMSSNKLRRIEVPDEWNITFGQIIPGATKNDRYQNTGSAGYGLRFYEGAKTTGKTRMVVSGVTEFWPEEIEMSEQHTETKRQAYGEDAPDGFKNSTVEAKVVRWRSLNGDGEDNGNKFLEQIESKEQF